MATGGTPDTPTRPRRVDPRIAETRRLVREAALDLIAEVGFEGTTIELISERSGVSRSTIYRHWPDPAALYLEAFDPPSPDLEPPPLTGDFTTDLTNYIHHVAARLNNDRFASALAAQVDKARRDPQYRQAHHRYALTRNEHGNTIFRTGITSGTLRPDLDPEYETDILLGYLVYQRLMNYRPLDDTLVTTHLRRTLARCLEPGRTAQ